MLVAQSRSPLIASEDDSCYQHLQNKALGSFKGMGGAACLPGPEPQRVFGHGRAGFGDARRSRQSQEKAAAGGRGRPVLPRGWPADNDVS